jgi:hypothetical protein
MFSLKVDESQPLIAGKYVNPGAADCVDVQAKVGWLKLKAPGSRA